MALFWGYVTDASNHQPIVGAYVKFECSCSKTWDAYSNTEQTGYYEISPPEIAIHNGHRLHAEAEKEGYIGQGMYIDPWDGQPFQLDFDLPPA